MSYILDALRKADAQRERDPARGIHAQPVRLGVGERRRQEDRTGFYAASAAGLAVLALAGWYLYRDSGSAPIVPPAPTEMVVAAKPSPMGDVAPSPPATAVLPPPVVVAEPVVAAPPVVARPPTAVKAEPMPASPAGVRQPAGNAPLPVASVSPRASAAPASAAAASPPAAVPANATPAATPAPAAAEIAAPIAGLPADAPKLAISGGVYSTNAGQRMLIVNGQVFNEGGEVGPGLVLEEIRAKAAVLRFRGSRYSVPY